MSQEAEEVDCVPGGGEIEAQATPRGARQILQMALAGEADEVVGEDRSVGHARA
jgi:hypothetical protein